MALKREGSRDLPWGGGRRRRRAAGVLAVVALALLLVLAVNLLAGRLLVRYPGLRLDLTEVRLHSLQAPTGQILGSLEREVRIIALFKTLDWSGAPATFARERREIQRRTFARIRDLLDEMRLRSPRISVEIVDADTDPKRAQALAEELELDPKRPEEVSRVVLFCGDRRRDVPLGEMAGLRFADPRTGAWVRPALVSFTAEDALASALVAVTRETPPRVYLLTGFGERQPEDTGPQGLASAVRFLASHGIETRPLDLAARGGIPRDAEVLALVGPMRDLFAPEAEALRAWLGGGGRALVLVDPTVEIPRVGEILSDFDLEPAAADLVAFDRVQGVLGGAWWDLGLLQGILRTHPITAPLAGLGFKIRLSAARPILRRGANRAVTPVPLLQTVGDEGETRRSYAIRGRPDRDTVRPVAFDPATDLPGPLILAWAVEIPGPLRAARLVAVGDSRFVSNEFLGEGANRDFLLRAVEWLLGSDERLGLAPVVDLDRTLVLTRSQDREFVAIFLVALPLAAAATGLLVGWRRRR